MNIIFPTFYNSRMLLLSRKIIIFTAFRSSRCHNSACDDDEFRKCVCCVQQKIFILFLFSLCMTLIQVENFYLFRNLFVVSFVQLF